MRGPRRGQLVAGACVCVCVLVVGSVCESAYDCLSVAVYSGEPGARIGGGIWWAVGEGDRLHLAAVRWSGQNAGSRSLQQGRAQKGDCIRASKGALGEAVRLWLRSDHVQPYAALRRTRPCTACKYKPLACTRLSLGREQDAFFALQERGAVTSWRVRVTAEHLAA